MKKLYLFLNDKWWGAPLFALGGLTVTALLAWVFTDEDFFLYDDMEKWLNTGFDRFLMLMGFEKGEWLQHQSDLKQMDIRREQIMERINSMDWEQKEQIQKAKIESQWEIKRKEWDRWKSNTEMEKMRRETEKVIEEVKKATERKSRIYE